MSKPPPARKTIPPRKNFYPGTRYGFEPYREIAMDFFRRIFDQHYTDLVITDESTLADYSYLCVEGYEHRFANREEALAAADQITREKVGLEYNLHLDSVHVPLYTILEQLRQQKVLH